jgi:hypothetical protein
VGQACSRANAFIRRVKRRWDGFKPVRRNGVHLACLAETEASLRHVAMLVADGSAPETVFDAVTKEALCRFGSGAARMIRFEPDATATILRCSPTQRNTLRRLKSESTPTSTATGGANPQAPVSPGQGAIGICQLPTAVPLQPFGDPGRHRDFVSRGGPVPRRRPASPHAGGR